MIQSIGDLAMSYSNRLSNSRIRTELNTLAQELATGRRADLRSALAGDVGPVSQIERSLSNLAAYDTVVSEAVLFLETAQTALSQISEHLANLSNAAFAMDNTSDPVLIATFGADANGRFASIVGALNTSVAGRSIFSGSDTGTSPVVRPSRLLDDIAASLPPNASASDVSDAVDGYFSPGGGFETLGYLGNQGDLAPMRLTPYDSVTFGVKATDPALRSALAATAKAALLDRGVLDGRPDQQSSLIARVGNDLLNAGASVVATRADVGTLEARTDEARTRNAAEQVTLEMAKSRLVGADPFDTATELQATQLQLETFFTVTARLSRLNLTGYLR